MIYVSCSGREFSRKFENGKGARKTDCEYVSQKTCLFLINNATLETCSEK